MTFIEWAMETVFLAMKSQGYYGSPSRYEPVLWDDMPDVLDYDYVVRRTSAESRKKLDALVASAHQC